MFFNNTNYVVYMYGALIQPNTIYQLENYNRYFEKVRNNITSVDMLILLNKITLDIINKGHLDNLIIENISHVNKFKIVKINGEHDIWVNNNLVKASDIPDNIIYSDNEIVLINNDNEVTLGVSE